MRLNVVRQQLLYPLLRQTSRKMSGCAIEITNQDALIDDVITVRVTGLKRREPVTVCAELVEGNTFCSHGCFVADDDGVVDISKQPSVAGTYEGVSPMGLFWSLKPAPGQPKGLRLVKRNASTPLGIDLTVIKGHLETDETYKQAGTKLDQLHIRRWYQGKGVQKIPVRTGRVRGMLFLPPGDGPFPGVIDLFGMVGFLMEFRAALLASRGFAALALPYLRYEGLPSSMQEVELEYFLCTWKSNDTVDDNADAQEAVDWFSSHPEVCSDVGVLGTSKGGEIALHLSYYSPKVKAVAIINGAAYSTAAGPMLYKKRRLVALSSPFYSENAVDTPDGRSLMNCWPCVKERFLPVWETDKKVLLIAGEDDRCLNPAILKTLRECYPDNKKDNCDLVVYPGAGHLIEPPYAPLTRTTNIVMPEFTGMFPIFWGGNPVDHAFAQEDSWRRILHHFRTNLHAGDGPLPPKNRTHKSSL